MIRRANRRIIRSSPRVRRQTRLSIGSTRSTRLYGPRSSPQGYDQSGIRHSMEREGLSNPDISSRFLSSYTSDHMVEDIDHIQHYYHLPAKEESEIRDIQPKFGYGSFSEMIFYRTYSRIKEDQKRESWSDVTVRCTEGCFTLLKNHMKMNHLPWSDEKWHQEATEMGKGMAKLKWTPPGRGLWGMGPLAFQRGAFVLNNCGAASTQNFVDGITWTMDGLMCGCGVGFDTIYNGVVIKPDKTEPQTYQIPDTKGGWVESVRRLVAAYIPDEDQTTLPFPKFDYSLIRPIGTPIKTFGGTASGHDPLKKLHHRLEVFFDTYLGYRESIERGDSVDQRVEIFNQLIDWLTSSDFSTPPPVITDAKNLINDLKSEKLLTRRLYNFLDQNRGKYLGFNSLITTFITELESADPEVEADYLLEKLDQLNDQMTQAKIKQMKQQVWDNRDRKTYDMTRLIVDCFNAVGACVVAGNVRRSSMLATSSPDNKTFSSLKDLSINPEREKIAFMSNNSVEFTSTDQYNKYLPACVEQTQVNGEPGYFFRLNVKRFGRIARYVDPMGPQTREREKDTATIPNPCSEIPLNPFELCNLAEIPINRFLKRPDDPDSEVDDLFELEDLFDLDGFLQACHWATMYTKSVSLLPTHHSRTNAIIKKNHRIGVSITGGAQVHDQIGSTYLTSVLREGYKKVRETDIWLSEKLGVRESIRVTTCKPSGTISLLTGSTPGIHFPHSRYCIRRVRVSAQSDFANILKEHDIKWEPDVYSDNTLVFTFYLDHGNVRSVRDVNLYEQLTHLSTYQREWSDNMVSVTITYDPEKERTQLEHAIAQYAPIIKSCSFLPNINGLYKQMPYEEITEQEYLDNHREYEIDWSKLDQTTKEPQIPRGCTNDTCSLN